MAKTYKFDEEDTTNYKGINYVCKVSKKYAETKKKATEIINDGKYGLTENDFWTLKQYINGAKENVCLYNGLIISHNGCKKINDKLAKPYNAKFVSEIKPFTFIKKVKSELKEIKGFYREYNEEEISTIAEISSENVLNDYPMSMLNKRLFDRTVLDKSKLSFMGIMSEAEIDDKQDMTTMFGDVEQDKKLKEETIAKFNKLSVEQKANILNVMHKTKPEDIETNILAELVRNAK